MEDVLLKTKDGSLKTEDNIVNIWKVLTFVYDAHKNNNNYNNNNNNNYNNNNNNNNNNDKRVIGIGQLW